MSILGVIPARYGSSRLPGKPLADIVGKTLIRRVVERASQAQSLSEVIVATDDQRIVDEVEGFGGQALLTDPKHMNGTARLLEVAELRPEFDAYVNIQGDEPFISPAQIDLVCDALPAAKQAFVSTLIRRLEHLPDLDNPATVKVAVGKKGRALYFSRSPIPFVRDMSRAEFSAQYGFFLHVGIYGFTTAALKEIRELGVSPLESAESLEQLRWLENGISIVTRETNEISISVDTPEDLEQAISYAKEHEQ